jgi:hypothetical protein
VHPEQAQTECNWLAGLQTPWLQWLLAFVRYTWARHKCGTRWSRA